MAGTALVGCLVMLAVLAGCGKKQCRVTYVKRGSATSVAMGRAAESPRVAILPFRCENAPEVGYTVAAAMAGQLGAQGDFTVVDPTVVAARAISIDGMLPPDEAGRALNAPYVISGEVVEYIATPEEGDRPTVGVTAQMIETSTGRVVWTENLTESGSAAWCPEDSVGILTARVCGDLAASVEGQWVSSSMGQGGTARRSASVAVPAVEVDDELVPVDDPFDMALEDVSPAIGGMIDFPEEAASPEQFGRDFEVEAETAAVFPEAEMPEALEKESDPESALLPVVPESLPPDHYVLPPEEAARFLEMAEDPLPAKPEAEKKPDTTDTAEKRDMPMAMTGQDAPETPVEMALPESEPEPVAAVVAEPEIPETPTPELAAPTPADVLPAAIDAPAEAVAEAEARPEPATVVPSPPTASLIETSALSLPVPMILPPPSEEIVPVNLGVELDEERFPLSKPSLQESMRKPEYGLDDDKDFRSVPSLGDQTATPVAVNEDELDFFGRMSASLELELTE
ncbi:MAG: hypothetical protein LUE17_01395 [Planctomycetaceae bacterium]|nr:hypothetical protein [Planctomycetaceae bacterium]